jgi:hypothetical protein
MKKPLLSKTAYLQGRSLKRILQSATSWGAYLDTLVCVQKIAIEDLEVYAIYEPNFLGVVLSIIMFKPVEYCLELIILTIANRWKS